MRWYYWEDFKDMPNNSMTMRRISIDDKFDHTKQSVVYCH